MIERDIKNALFTMAGLVFAVGLAIGLILGVFLLIVLV